MTSTHPRPTIPIPSGIPAGAAAVHAGRLDADPAAVEVAITVAETRYAAVQEQLRAVDAKAGLAATVQAAALGILLTTPPAPAGRTGLQLAAVGVLLVALGLSGAVITPRLARRVPHADRDPLWFGALRRWDPAALAAHLVGQSPTERLAELTRQLVTVAAICWFKHRAVAASLVVSGAALLLQLAAHLTLTI